MARPPELAAEDIRAICLNHFGVEIVAHHELPSYDDRNYRVSAADHRAFVLKVASAATSRAELELQNEAMEFLAAKCPEIPVPRVVRSVSAPSHSLVALRLPGGEPVGQGQRAAHDARGPTHAQPRDYLVRLISFLEGDVLANVPMTDALLEDFGAALGAMDRALAAWSPGPEASSAAERTMDWDQLRAAEVIEAKLDAVADPGKRARVERVLALFRAEVCPLVPSLRRSIVHNDANVLNVVAAGDKVTGIIDFGDLMRTALVCNASISAAYLMLDTEDPLRRARVFLAGYAKVMPLTEAEWKVMFPLCLTRLCVSIVMGLAKHRLEPENHYILVHQESNWKALDILERLTPEEGTRLLRQK